MTVHMAENNQVMLTGKIAAGFSLYYQVFGEDFYKTEIRSRRLSGVEDWIPVTIPGRLIDMEQCGIGKEIEICGQFRSWNQHEPGRDRDRLLLSVFARDAGFVEETDEAEASVNRIFLDGYLCRQPVLRITPRGREVADLLLGVNRTYGKTDYIPCICWGKAARYAATFRVGGHILAWGRIQSREYIKKLGENRAERRTAYEVSIGRLEYTG